MSKPPKGSGYAGCCESCDDPDPRWRIERQGDAAVSWSCDDDLSKAVDRMRRDHEVTHLMVFNRRKQKTFDELREVFQQAEYETTGHYGHADSVQTGNCGNLDRHMKCPVLPFSWDRWATEMRVTHEQEKCPGCGYFAIWVPKDERS